MTQQLEGKTALITGGGHCHSALIIEDLEQAFDGVLAAGATQPADAARPWVRCASVKDQGGKLLELIQACDDRS